MSVPPCASSSWMSVLLRASSWSPSSTVAAPSPVRVRTFPVPSTGDSTSTVTLASSTPNPFG